MTTTTRPLTGLTDQEAAERRARGQGNNVHIQTGRTYADILRQNVFTLINVIIFVIGAVMIALGRYGDAFVSVGLILMNVVIGVYQEARAKRQLDQIALLTRPKISVMRGGQEKTVDPSELVIGDLIVVRAGDQIVVDGTVVGDGRIDADESLLTGESDLIAKRGGDTVLSGSFVVTGTAMYEATQVGADSFANKLTASAKAYRSVKTPLQQDVDLVIGILMLIALFIGFMLLISAVLYSLPTLRSVQMAAVIAGLVPNGLFFMVIVAYALGALRIVQRGALIQQSNSVESLSNVTVLCMDKTGTLTANRIHYADALPLGSDKADLLAALGNYAHSVTASNKTSEALAQALSGEAHKLVDEVPFSSARKWSAITLEDGVYALGAVEMLQPYLSADHPDFTEQLQTWSDAGLRVLLFAHHPEAVMLHDTEEQPLLPNDLQPMGLLSFGDELRPSLKETLEGFAQANIQLKVISGDNPFTVAALARQAGFTGDLQVISGTQLAQMSDAEFEQAAAETTVFGRITPEQKEKLVDSLRRRGHYVAMIGDGVNDVLSLKKAHLGIAMQSGSAATRGVADMILLEDSFAALPPAFLEGQRIVNGMRDILRLFLTRALMVALLIISIAMVDAGFPYVPKHVSLLTLLTVGIPTFALAIWARPAQTGKRLLTSVLHFVLPATISIFIFAIIIYLFYFVTSYNRMLGLVITPAEIASFEQSVGIDYPLLTQDDYAVEMAGAIARTALTTFTILTGLLLVVFVEPPVEFFVGGDELSSDRRPTILAVALLFGFVLVVLIAPLRNFFELIPLRLSDYAIIGAVVLVWMLVVRAAWRGRWLERLLNLETL